MKLHIKSSSITSLTLAFLIGATTAACAQRASNLPLMKRPITLSLWSMPLHTALSRIAAVSGVNLTAAPDLMHYRISVAVHNQPLIDVMNEIVDLFGHGTIPYHDYGWAHVTKPDGYELERNGEAIEHEQQMLQYPAEEMPHQLREIIRFIRMPLKQRRKIKNTDSSWIAFNLKHNRGHLLKSTSIVTDALRVITSEQLASLISDGQVEVDQCHPSSNAMKQLQINTTTSSFAPPNTSIQASQFKKPILTLTPSPPDEFVTGLGEYQIGLQYMVGPQQYRSVFITIDPLQTQWPIHNKVSHIPGPIVDIRPTGVTVPVLRTTCQHALMRLAKVSDLQIISEAFVAPPLVLVRSKGTAENVLDAICRSYGYNWRKVGDTYLVYSRAWAQDRQADIPQHLLDAWNQSISQHGYVTLRVLGQMSSMNKWQMPTITYSTGYQIAHKKVFTFLHTLSSSDLQQTSLPQGFTYFPTRAATRLLWKIDPGQITIPPYNVKTRVRSGQKAGIPSHATVIITDSRGTTIAAIRQPLVGFLKLKDDLVPPANRHTNTANHPN